MVRIVRSEYAQRNGLKIKKVGVHFKPDSVGQFSLPDNHSSGPFVAKRLERSTWKQLQRVTEGLHE